MSTRLSHIVALTVIMVGRLCGDEWSESENRARLMGLQLCIVLQEHDEQTLLSGKRGGLSLAFAEKLGLTENERVALAKLVSRVRAAVSPLDQRAKEITQAARNKYPAGRVPRGEAPPSPPLELGHLQTQRDAVLQAAFTELERDVGSTMADKLVSYIKVSMREKIPRMSPVVVPGDIGSVGARRANPAGGKGVIK